MSLFFYGIFFLGVVLGGLLVLFSLLSMAPKSDQDLDQREGKKLQRQDCPTPLLKQGKLENLRVPVASDLYHGGTIETRIFINR